MLNRTGVHISITQSIDSIDQEAVIVVPLFEGDNLDNLPSIATLGGERLRRALERKSTFSVYEVTLFDGDSDEPSIALVGAGKPEDFELVRSLRTVSAASRYLTARGYRHLAIMHRDTLIVRDEFEQSAVEGAIRGVYDPGIKKTGEHSIQQLDVITLVSTRENPDPGGAEFGQIVGESANIARDLVNLPPNILTPTALGNYARDLAAQNGFACEILDQDDMRRLGMGAILGVAAGSAQPPRVIVMRYGNPDAAIKLALVGKGLTFDSGGLSLKTAEGMETMKGDMGGGAAVIAGMAGVARFAPKNICVTGYVGATENMPGGGAMRPGDVLTAMTGKTIEVLNTDAEGRLVLADLLAYASQQGATHIVDFATLTGGAVVALGYAATLACGKPDRWVKDVVRCARHGIERAWRMPLYEEYRRAMDSDVADIKNTGGRAGSALTATAFLADFVDGPKWAHMDIAGTAFATKASPYQPTGGTGAGVGTILSLVRQMDHGTVG